MTKQTCLLCGIEDHDVTVSLVEWAKPIDKQRWSAIPRCRDREGCRARVGGNGDPWEVAEAEPRTIAEIIRSIGR
jgi:hypothetical protein